MARVFICYANQDRTIAETICSKLEASGIRCWIAPRDVASGKNWDKAITEAISQSRIMVLVFSVHSNDSDYCINEIGIGFDKKAEIIPFFIDDTSPSGGMELYLRRKQWLNAQKPPLELHLNKLVEEVKAYQAQIAAREEVWKKATESSSALKQAEALAAEQREDARIKKESGEAARAREATLKARQEAEEAIKEKERREAEAAKARREAEAAVKEKELREAEAAKARKEGEEAKKASEAAIRARQEAEAASPASKEKKLKRNPGPGWLYSGAFLTLVGLVVPTWFSFYADRTSFSAQWPKNPWSPIYPQWPFMLAISLPFLLPGIILLRHGTIDYRQDETSEAKNSGWWWLLPIVLSLPGGIIAWAIIKKHNWRQARNMLATGILLALLVPGVLFSLNKAPPQQNPHVSSNTTIPAQAMLLAVKPGDVSNISFSLSH